MEPVTRKVMNLAHFLRQSAQRLPDVPGIIRGEDKLSFSQLDRLTSNACAALAKLGVGKGDRILVQSRNSFEMFLSMFVAFRLGAIWVPVNFRLGEDEVGYIAANSQAKLMIYDPVFAGHRDAAKRMGALQHVVSFGDAGPGEIAWQSLVEKNAPFEDCPVDYDDPCWFFFTSGTTGHPKAAMLTHGQMGFVITNHIADLMPGLGPDDASLVVAPLSHGAGIHQLSQVARGVPTILLQGTRFDVEEVFALIEHHRVTNMFTVPTILKTMVESDAVDRFDHSSLRHVIYAGAPTYRVDQQFALTKLGKCIVQYFGMGEVTGNITVLPPHLHDADDKVQGRIGSCGYARMAMQIQIQNEDGDELTRGETGEICVIGPAVFAGYYRNDEANAKAFRNGWFRTGDLGHMDGEGYVYITGRASDMYISGGSNIYPREIEEKLLEHPDIRECAIVGMPDPKWGEVGVAAIVPRELQSFDLDAFTAWMGDRIARYKLPQSIEIFDALPVSGYGKITKKLVKEALFARKE